MASVGRDVALGCAIVPFALVAALVVFFGISRYISEVRSETCASNPVSAMTVRVAKTEYTVPSTVPVSVTTRTGKSSYRADTLLFCQRKGAAPAKVEIISLNEGSVSVAAKIRPDLADGLRHVRSISIDGRYAAQHPQTRSSPKEPSGITLLGSPVTYTCWTGYYGPGHTCRFHGRTEDGADITIQVHPREAIRGLRDVMLAVDQLVRALRTGALNAAGSPATRPLSNFPS